MISLCTLLICWTVSSSRFGNVGASLNPTASTMRQHSPAARHAKHASDLPVPQREDWTKGSLLLWNPLRVFRLVPQILCCATKRRDLRGVCKPVWESTEKEVSRTPVCRNGHLREGDKVPRCVWKQYTQDSKWSDLDSRDIFNNKRVVIIGLPGAFTPVCTSWQLPEFEAAYNELKAEGIDAVYCITVNDTFVTTAWGKHLNIKNVVIVPDGNGCFAFGMGMLVRKSNFGFGCRSWRYAAVVNDGVIEKLFMEPCMHDDATTDTHSASKAEMVLSYLRTSQDKTTEDKKKADTNERQLSRRQIVSSN